MRVVNRKEFLQLPVGTIYHEFEPCHWGRMLIKQSTLWFEGEGNLDVINDFFYQQLPEVCGNYNWTADLCLGKSVPVDLDLQGRDGLFEGEAQYLIWEKDDVAQLIEKLLSYPQNRAFHDKLLIASELPDAQDCKRADKEGRL